MNPVPNYTSDLSGYFFAFDASGGFTVQEGFKNIIVNPIQKLVMIDATNTVQVVMDYKYINSLLGISYEIITPASEGIPAVYDICGNTDTYIDASGIFIGDPSDNITINAKQFISQIVDPSINVLSVGGLSTLYSDFYSYIQSVFTPSVGSTIFNTSPIDISNSGFTNEEFITLINGTTPYDYKSTSAYINDLSGQIVISNISQIIRYSCEYNIFNNRANGQTVYNAFQPGDLIYVRNGLQILLNVGLTNNTSFNIGSLINQNQSELNYTNSTIDGEFTNSMVNIDPITDLSSISRSIQIPLLIVLKDLTPLDNSYIINPLS